MVQELIPEDAYVDWLVELVKRRLWAERDGIDQSDAVRALDELARRARLAQLCVKCGAAWSGETGKSPCPKGGECVIPAACAVGR